MSDAKAAKGVAYRWVAMGVVLFGTFMVVLDTTVVNLGLPSMQRDFGTVDGVEWVVTAYLAAVGIAHMSSGWVADHFGRKQAFIAAMWVFIVGSVLCAAAPSLEVLVAARVVQGIGGGVLLPVAVSTIYELFEPDERGRAMGIYGIAVMVAPAVGPVLGGGLVQAGGWRWLFIINIPIGLVAVPVAMRYLRDSGFRNDRPLDVWGLLLSGIGMALLLVGLSLGGINGWDRPVVIVALVASAVVLVVFCLHALRTPHPLVDMRILTRRVFAVGMVALGLLSVVQYSRLVYVPLELGSARGVSELQIGLIMLPSAIGIAVMMPLGGRMADKVGARLPVIIGVVLLLASFWPLAHLSTDTSLVTISAILFLGGLGSGLALMAPNILAMNSVPMKEVSQASGLSAVSRQLSAAVGTAILAAVFATIRPPGSPDSSNAAAYIDSYNTVFMIGFGVLVALLAVSMFLPGKSVARRLQQERSAEAAELHAAVAATDS
ncbi:MAG: MDR family MFS transporter [Microthrixaceae bacterium]